MKKLLIGLAFLFAASSPLVGMEDDGTDWQTWGWEQGDSPLGFEETSDISSNSDHPANLIDEAKIIALQQQTSAMIEQETVSPEDVLSLLLIAQTTFSQ
jgi:hypothetical protein